MLSVEELSAREQEIASARDLAGLLKRLEERARPLLQGTVPAPPPKAMLTSNGGVCADDGSRLEFNPWKPEEHRCRRCGKVYRGERHDRAWAHYQHLWLAERAAHLAAVAVFGHNQRAGETANALLQSYRAYPEYPNRDNVLGPSRLFFSTYLESVWMTNYLAAAMLLRESNQLQAATADVVAAVADDAATLIGDFDEGLSNRQTWHNAALASIAVWFEDEELATRAIEAPSGMLVHLLQGFGSDGMWFEGDNYHLFALRGQLVAMGWARQAGVDLLADVRLQHQLAAALRAPALTALPDRTFPARKDSRFGVSLAQPMYLELWEIGLARLVAAGNAPDDLWAWLKDLYDSPAPPAQTFDSYLHEAGEADPSGRRRTDLSWWSLLEMVPALPDDTPPWSPESTFIESQGLAVLRDHDRYVSLECGLHGGGHGHSDRLNLTLHADGQYWLPDFGTGSYVARNLFWYRSTLAHNAPRLDGVSQPLREALCDNFEVQSDWAWVRGRFGDLSRTVVAGPQYILDVVELAAAEDHLLELPLHLNGNVELAGSVGWDRAEDSGEEFVEQPERFARQGNEPILLRCSGRQGATLSVHLLFEGDLLRARAPGPPDVPELVPFYLLRSRGRNLRLVSVLEPTTGEPSVSGLRLAGSAIEVETTRGNDRHLATVEGWETHTAAGGVVRLGGARRHSAPFVPLVQTNRPLIARGAALPTRDAPALDGSLEGFDTSEPLELDHEDQYRRSEEPYMGPEEFAARAYANWSDEGLYLAVEVTKAEVFPRDPDAPPLALDNEPDEIHGDGIQVYLRLPQEEAVYGVLVVPSGKGSDLIVRPVGEPSDTAKRVRGSWRRTDTGYTVTLAITPPRWTHYRPEEELGFDLLVNQMLPGHLRRAGQLVWSGGGGWVWLRGDRQDPARLGVLELR